MKVTVRLRGEGEMAANEGEPGDLYVVVHIKQNPNFIREGDDLWHIAVITYPQAALGAEISVPTIEGPTTIKIASGNAGRRNRNLTGQRHATFPRLRQRRFACTHRYFSSRKTIGSTESSFGAVSQRVRQRCSEEP